jgi:hypothetical protein
MRSNSFFSLSSDVVCVRPFRMVNSGDLQLSHVIRENFLNNGNLFFFFFFWIVGRPRRGRIRLTRDVR